MSTYFVTGATGFIGRRLVAELLRRPDCERVFALVRSHSANKLEPHGKLTPMLGDLGSPIDADRVVHVVHLAALHDFTASADDAFPAATPERAAQALERRPEEVDLPSGVLVRKSAPKAVRSLVHLAYRAMPEQSAPRTSPPASVAGVTRPVLRATR
ncbi:SDR family oxidoreductase [Saccharothrix sp. S26]|uniref:SDR family oxidoreductase n=1 Tax=Saccharothrix sp. S26 TaxID=2907215 RepID=UPI001F26A4C6|nr:SDR family oxidoreductase [Saccharothrix sp. S26]MCE6993472.1 SDR family oxidoreductase [Saccharothrix sp. S26]